MSRSDMSRSDMTNMNNIDQPEGQAKRIRSNHNCHINTIHNSKTWESSLESNMISQRGNQFQVEDTGFILIQLT